MTEIARRLPFELSDYIYSFVGEHELAKIIKKTTKNIADAIETSHMIDHYVEDDFKLQFFASLKLFREVHGNYYPFFDPYDFALSMSSGLYDYCYYCERRITRQELVDYFMECQVCHAKKLGTEVYECNNCGFETLDETKMCKYKNTMICDDCFETEVDSE